MLQNTTATFAVIVEGTIPPSTLWPRFSKSLQLLSPRSTLQRGHHFSVQEGGLPGSGELEAHHAFACGLQDCLYGPGVFFR